MEVYTTSFTYPRRSRHIHPAPSSIDFPVQELRSSSNDSYPHLQQTQTNAADPAASDAIQKLALMAMSLHGCHVTYFVADQNRGWNFHITGAYQQVMATRGMILKECPIQVKGFASADFFREAQPLICRISASCGYQSDTFRNPRFPFFKACLEA
jgi:hypothetical protein